MENVNDEKKCMECKIFCTKIDLSFLPAFQLSVWKSPRISICHLTLGGLALNIVKN